MADQPQSVRGSSTKGSAKYMIKQGRRPELREVGVLDEANRVEFWKRQATRGFVPGLLTKQLPLPSQAGRVPWRICIPLEVS